MYLCGLFGLMAEVEGVEIINNNHKTDNFRGKEKIMAKDLDELKMIVDLAKTGGIMEARNMMMEEQMRQKDDEIAQLKEMLKEKDKVIARKDKQLADKDKQIEERDKQIEEKDARIKELESLMVTVDTTENGQTAAGDQPPLVIIQQYFLLDMIKTISYVLKLNDSQKMFVGHMLHQTMPDDVPKPIYDKVDAMTRLDGSQTGRLADAMEKVVEKPTTQNIVYPQAGSTANVGCDLKDTEFKVLPVNADQPAALDSNIDQSDYGREGYTEAYAD